MLRNSVTSEVNETGKEKIPAISKSRLDATHAGTMKNNIGTNLEQVKTFINYQACQAWKMKIQH